MSYLTLAAAIIESGIKTNDTAFLNSEWCKFLKSAIAIRVEHLSKDKSGIKTNDTAFLNSGWYKFLKLAIAIRVEHLSKDKSGISLEHTGGKRET